MSNQVTSKVLGIALPMLLLVSVARGSERPPTYHADVAPLFEKHCLDCHGPDEADGGFRVDTYERLLAGGDEAGRAVVPESAEKSPLLQYLTGAKTPRMPYKRKPLSEAEIAIVRDWIAAGAPEGARPVTFTEEQIAFFETDVRPLFAQHCLQCHGDSKANGNLAFLSRQDLLEGGTRGPALVPGKPGESLLLAAVRHSGDLAMPRNGSKLDEDSIETLEKWVRMGAPWPEVDRTDPPKIRRRFVVYESDRTHWSFQPVVRPELPKVESKDWPRDDLDRFVLARLEDVGLSPAPRASRRTLMRRLSFDLTGLPPTPEDLARYANEASDATLEEYVDELLESEAFGVHWARHWLDHVRYRPNKGKSERDDPYRQWVAKAFQDDMPYDRFLRMQIAGDLLPAESPDEVHLDGLVAVRPWAIKSRQHDQIDLLGRTFLGLSLYCARCHDHKLEPIARSDFYALAGVFESSQVVQVPYLRDRSRFDEYQAGLERTRANETRMKKELKKFSSVAAIVSLRGRIETERAKLDDPGQNREKVQQNLDKLLADEKRRLADIEKKGIDLDAPEAVEYARLWRENDEFTSTWKNVFQLDALVDQSDPEKIGDAAPPKPGAAPSEEARDEPVPRRFPLILAGPDQTPLGERTSGSGRLELADWLADPEHPITARLITNRIWYYLLGEGLVPSLSNFGRSGRPPSHPELLDHLSSDLLADGWSTKRLIRRIVLSSTYQQASTLDTPRDERDERLRLFGLARRRRLEVEPILRTINRLEHDPKSRERPRDPSIDLVNEMRLLFDGPNRDLIVPRRSSSISPLQSLFLMNSDHVRTSTERIAARLCRHSDEDAERIERAFLLLYGRTPSEKEVALGREFLAGWQVPASDDEDRRRKPDDVPPDVLARWQAYVQVLLAANEFVYVD